MLFLKNLLLRNFQGCCLLFNYQGSSLFLLIRSSSDILSRRFSLVKNFFIFLFAVCFGFFLPHKSAYLDYHINFSLSRTFFIFSFQFFNVYFLNSESNGEGGIWTLAPLLTTYSLSRGAPSASLGTSPKCPCILHDVFLFILSSLPHIPNFSAVHVHFQGKQKEVHSILNFPSGEGGIRTHAPSRTNGFQDRLVMTTSIPLHTPCSSYRLNCLVCPRDNVYSSIILPRMSTPFFYFFYFFAISSLKQPLKHFDCSPEVVFYFRFFKNTSAISRSSGVVILIFS